MTCKDYNVFALIPGRTWTVEFGRSFSNLCVKMATVRLPGAKTQRFHIVTSVGSMLPQIRESLFRNSIAKGATHQLWLDTDMVFPPDLCHRLIAHDKNFVAAQGVTKKVPADPCAQGLDGKKLSSHGRTGIEVVRHVGLALALLRVEPMKDIKSPLFQMQWTPELNGYSGEDVHFCYKWKAHTADNIYIDHDLSLQVGHVGTYVYSHHLVEMEVEDASRNESGKVLQEAEAEARGEERGPYLSEKYGARALDG